MNRFVMRGLGAIVTVRCVSTQGKVDEILALVESVQESLSDVSSCFGLESVDAAQLSIAEAQAELEGGLARESCVVVGCCFLRRAFSRLPRCMGLTVDDTRRTPRRDDPFPP